MKRKCHGLEMKNQELMTRNKELGAKMKEVQDLNIRLQRALLEKLSCPHCEKKGSIALLSCKFSLINKHFEIVPNKVTCT